MKTTTFPPMKIGKNQFLLPSGIKSSKDGKCRYWQCSDSGMETFAKPDYWVKIMAKYKTEDNLIKTYVCKKAQALLDEGLTQSEIITKLNRPETLAERKEKEQTKKIKKDREKLTKRTKGAKRGKLKDFVVGKINVEVVNDDGVTEVVKQAIYPWQGDPNYFGGGVPSPLSIAEATKEACAFPAKNLDNECRGCPFHAECRCTARFSEEDWKKPRSKSEVKIKAIKSFE